MVTVCARRRHLLRADGKGVDGATVRDDDCERRAFVDTNIAMGAANGALPVSTITTYGGQLPSRRFLSRTLELQASRVENRVRGVDLNIGLAGDAELLNGGHDALIYESLEVFSGVPHVNHVRLAVRE